MKQSAVLLSGAIGSNVVEIRESPSVYYRFRWMNVRLDCFENILDCCLLFAEWLLPAIILIYDQQRMLFN